MSCAERQMSEALVFRSSAFIGQDLLKISRTLHSMQTILDHLSALAIFFALTTAAAAFIDRIVFWSGTAEKPQSGAGCGASKAVSRVRVSAATSGRGACAEASRAQMHRG
jgi:hypothetical protein